MKINSGSHLGFGDLYEYHRHLFTEKLLFSLWKLHFNLWWIKGNKIIHNLPSLLWNHTVKCSYFDTEISYDGKKDHLLKCLFPFVLFFSFIFLFFFQPDLIQNFKSYFLWCSLSDRIFSSIMNGYAYIFLL